MELAISNSELSKLIGDIYEGSLTGEWQNVLNTFMDYTASNKAFFFLQKMEEEAPLILELATNFDIPPEALLYYQENPLDDPYHQTTSLLTEGESHYCNEYEDLQKHKGGDFYNKVLEPMKAYHVLVGVLCRDGEHESVFAINRDEGEQAYSLQEKNLFELITPHFSRAMHIFKELRLYKNYANISKSILDQQDKAILVCDANGTVAIHNDYAEQKLTLPSVIYLTNNSIHISISAYHKRLQYFIEQCANLAFKDIGVQETLVIEQEDGDSILITVSPLLNKNTFIDIDIPCCLVTINYQHQINWENVEREFELTPKEMQLLKAIYAKQKLNDLTAVFNVTYNTLRTHLQSIFKKADVNSQTELLVKLNMF
ncbi:MAG: LuxR C-terminal-related transcriptional regulator [Colwellia sp.]|nr:LuxR C-terminal-related transcriptional regulator [Colwellia sp.]MCW9081244.1 LuxR C-terminal-related transcriptional regulator [Colwellia sp.]